MDYFGLEHDLDSLWRSTESPLHAVTLAWYLRKRDTREALALLDRAGPLDGRLAPRAALVRGEAAWLLSEFDRSARLIEEAREGFERHEDALGVGDCLLAEASLQHELGRAVQRKAALEAALAAYSGAGDRLRTLLAGARLANFAGYENPAAAQQRWGAVLDEAEASGHPGLQAAALMARGSIAFQGDAPASARAYQRGFDLAIVAGDLLGASLQATNAGAVFVNMHVSDLALEWMERGQAAVQHTGWPRPTAWCKVQMAAVLSDLKRFEHARVLLEEGRAALATCPGRPYAHACWYLGEVCIELGDAERAVALLEETERLGESMSHADLVAHGLRGQAQGHSLAGRSQQALAAARRGLDFAREQGNRWHEVLMLQVLAQIARQHGLPLPEGSAAPSAPAYYLEQALAVGSSIDGYGVAPGLHADLSRDHEGAGNWQQALYHERQAARAREAAQSKQASDRAVAMQIRYETDKAKAEAEHHKAMAAIENQRAQALEAAHDTLQYLALVGQEITAHLDAEAVFQVLHRNAGLLLDVSAISVFLVEAQQLVLRYGIENGQPLPQASLALDDPQSLAARCVRERNVIALDLTDAREPLGAVLPGTRAMASVMFAPMLAGEAVQGVLSLQSDRPLAYAEREQQIVRMLAAYGAVALSNVRHAQQLARAEAEAEHLRALGLEHANQALTQEAQRLARASFEDPLTGLYNRRRLDVEVSNDLSRRSTDRPFSVALVDIDFFKRINDGYSHQMGDEVLREVGALLRQSCRHGDLAVRYGGEEFALVFASAVVADAHIACERLRSTVEYHAWSRLHPELKVTVSIGVADNSEADTPEAMFALADKRLYAAKAAGRNQVVCTEPNCVERH